MGKGEELTTTKYLIHAQINANGIVEKPDVVGAVFGQTEGLLSNDLDLRELQRTGRIGRIQVMIHSNGGRAKGEFVIPSSLDRVDTAILAASLETINRVGPCEAEIHTVKVEDVRQDNLGGARVHSPKSGVNHFNTKYRNRLIDKNSKKIHFLSPK